MRIPSTSILWSFVISITSFKRDNHHLVGATNVRRGSTKLDDEISDMSPSSAHENISPSSLETRYLTSYSTLTDAEIFALKKTPPALKSSKCGGSLLRRQHPLCERKEEDVIQDQDNPTKPPSIPLFSPPTDYPTQPLPTSTPTTSSPTSPGTTRLPSTSPTTMPSATPTRSLQCVQTVQGNELTIPKQQFFKQGEVHCLTDETGQEAYFGFTWTNEFGLFVNGQAVWTAPQDIVSRSDRWMFQNDGNLLLRNAANTGIWRTSTAGNWNSQMVVSFRGVWIASTGSCRTLWSQPPNAQSPTCAPTPAPTPTPPPTRLGDRPLNCKQTVRGSELSIPKAVDYKKGEVHCLELDSGDQVYFGYNWENQFGLFLNGRSVWTVPYFGASNFDRWHFQNDGNLVMRSRDNNSIWTSRTNNKGGTRLKITSDKVWIETDSGVELWSEPSYLGAPYIPLSDYPDPNHGLQYWAYYYPWYLRDNWGRHDYQDEPLLGKYGTNEVAVAEQHIEWALQAGISTWIISWWGPNHLAMNHFKAGMMNAPSLNKMKFCMLYESVILDDYGSWRDGSKEERMYQHLKVIRDEFIDHPSYLKINGRPVIIFYITRSRMMWQDGFNGPSVLANLRRRLGMNIYFIADEPFFNSYNRSPDNNQNAFKNGNQVFDAYTTYNMFVDSRVQRGETATDYQLREGMPIWKRWAERVPLFPNVMPQYYDFRGHKPLLGNSFDFMRQLREVACLPRTNFNGAPHVMMITSFNEWWEGTQVEPENGSPDNWNNYGFQFLQTLANFKKEVDSRGTPWCDEEVTSANGNG